MNGRMEEFSMALLRAASIPNPEQVRAMTYEHTAGGVPTITVIYWAHGADAEKLTETVEFVPKVVTP